jgi:hypothetical protein
LIDNTGIASLAWGMTGGQGSVLTVVPLGGGSRLAIVGYVLPPASRHTPVSPTGPHRAARNVACGFANSPIPAALRPQIL